MKGKHQYGSDHISGSSFAMEVKNPGTRRQAIVTLNKDSEDKSIRTHHKRQLTDGLHEIRTPSRMRQKGFAANGGKYRLSAN